MKIVAQDVEHPEQLAPGRHVRYFVVPDDFQLGSGERRDALIVSPEAPGKTQVPFNGTWALDHGGWFPFTGDQAILDELLPEPARRTA